jgi:hypothetical protein
MTMIQQRRVHTKASSKPGTSLKLRLVGDAASLFVVVLRVGEVVSVEGQPPGRS